MIRYILLFACLIAGLLSMHYRTPGLTAAATLAAIVLTMPLRRNPRRFDSVPKRKEGHV